MQLKRKIKRLLIQLPFIREFRPAWFDESRLVTQGSTFRTVLSGEELTGKCLNAGCGEGLYSEFLESFQEITEIVNLDLTLPSILEQRMDTRHKAKEGSLTNLPFDNEIFDCCLCTEVIEHIKEDTVAVSELARVIKPGGLLLLSVPTPPAPYEPAHVREGYTLQELSDLLGKHGFTIKRHAYCFYIFMRIFFHLWQWQFYNIAKGQGSYFPRILVLTFGYVDRYFKFGKPWDLVILAQKLKQG